jgi:hypothetical protein
LDPSNTRAKEGKERVEKHNDVGLESTYDVDIEDMEGSDNDVSVLEGVRSYGV